MIDEEEARLLVSASRATVVRDRKGRDRRVYEIASVSVPLSGRAKREAMDSYRGVDKYTYMEHFEAAQACHMLKRYIPSTGQFVKWPENKTRA